MPTQEIKETEWQKFCARFEEAHRGVFMSLDMISHDGATSRLANNEPLDVFRFQKNAGCSDVIQIELAAAGQHIQHEIVEPIHVRLREEGRSQKLIEIDAESGSIRMRFASGQLGSIFKDFYLSSPEELGS